MNSPARHELEARIEALCRQGCRRVWQVIEILEQGGDLPETQDLSMEERRRVIHELKQIMAVYGESCSLD